LRPPSYDPKKSSGLILSGEIYLPGSIISILALPDGEYLSAANGYCRPSISVIGSAGIRIYFDIG